MRKVNNEVRVNDECVAYEFTKNDSSNTLACTIVKNGFTISVNMIKGHDITLEEYVEIITTLFPKVKEEWIDSSSKNIFYGGYYLAVLCDRERKVPN